MSSATLNFAASTAYLTICSALVFFMTPGVGLLYSGLSHSKNALQIILLSMLSYAVVTIQFCLFGFSLAFSESGSSFIGNFDFAGLAKIGSQPLLLVINNHFDFRLLLSFLQLLLSYINYNSQRYFNFTSHHRLLLP
jgi:ammonia channel protein AmtB